MDEEECREKAAHFICTLVRIFIRALDVIEVEMMNKGIQTIQ